MTATATESLTLVNDGQTRWLADTAELVAEMNRLGWRVDEKGPGDLIRDDGDAIHGGSYSELCSDVERWLEYPENPAVAPEIAAESIRYIESRQGWEASPGLVDALRAAKRGLAI